MRNFIFAITFAFAFIANAQSNYHDYYFRTLDVKSGLSHNTVNQIIQDRRGFLWFGTKEGLNRYDGVNFRIYKKENSDLKRNFITALYEDEKGHIWIGTDNGVFIYNPILDSFTSFDKVSNKGDVIHDFVTTIDGDENGNIWMAVEYQGLFCYKTTDDILEECFSTKNSANITHFWRIGKTVWFAKGMDNLYYSNDDFATDPHIFKDESGNEIFKNDIINFHVGGLHNYVFVASKSGLTEINLTTRNTKKILNDYVRALKFRNDNELWIGTEHGLYIYYISTKQINHITVPDQDDPYSLSDNAIYTICKDRENGMWIGSYFGGVNYAPYEWTYFEKFYPHGQNSHFGRRVREICESNDGTLWIGTEDKGLFNFDPQTKKFTSIESPYIYNNVHALCLDGENLWVGTFAGGLNRMNIRTRQVKHYSKGESDNSLDANDVFCAYITSTNDLWIGTTAGLLKYNRKTDDFTRIAQPTGFVYSITEAFSNGAFCYNIRSNEWKNYMPQNNDSTSLPYNKLISVFEDSKKRIWLMTLGYGFCRYNPESDNFTRFDMNDGFPSNTFYRMVEDTRGNLWLTTTNGLVRYNPETNSKHVYTTANGLLSNSFNFQSGYIDKQGLIYMGTINGLVAFDPDMFEENPYQPPVVITDFYLYGKRITVDDPKSPLTKSIIDTDNIELDADQNTFSFQVAALSYQAPEMNQLMYKMEGIDREWYSVGRNARINYSNLPFGSYKLRIKGSNSDSRWNPEERTLFVHIKPPFYLSIWAYIFYALSILCIIFFVIAYYIRQAKQKQQQAMEHFEREKERELYTAKIDFFTNVAHEIRTPLTLIKSPLENVLSSSSNLDVDVKENLEIMDMNTNRLLDLINQLLDFRKTETKGFKINCTKIDIAALLQKTCKRFSSMMQDNGLTITIDAPESLLASADKEAVTKIFSNLLTNAIKYGNTYICIKLNYDDMKWYLEVDNDGEIVPAEMREEIFKPFSQYRTKESKPVQGTGIGLALARSLAELHEGTLRMVEDISCNGFLLTIPIEQKNTVAIKQEEWADEIPTEITNDNASHLYTVLVVEDNKDVRSFVAKQLSSDYYVHTASNGIEALEVLKNNIIHLVITDIMMPEMDGLELCQHIKSDLDFSHIPVILLTAKTTDQAKIEGVKMGADDYIIKPFSTQYLKASVASLLENREKLRAALLNSPFIHTNSIAITKADEEFLKRLDAAVKEHMQDPDFNLDEMANVLGMSRSSLNRKIKGVMDITPNDYIRLERLKKAAEILKDGTCQVNEVCYMVGFNTPSYFTKCFQKQFGTLPKNFARS